MDNPNIALMGAIEAAANMYEGAYLEARGRGFISMKEAWAQLKENLERVSPGAKAAGELHKDMWLAAVDKNEDAFCAYAHELSRHACRLAQEWAVLQALADIAAGHADLNMKGEVSDG